MNPARAANQHGFVLVATLWFLAAITIVAAYFADRVGKSVESAAQSRRMTEAMVQMAGTRADTLFHFATDGFSNWGLGFDPVSAIALDDRPYRGVGKDVVRIQDTRGLLSLNFPDQLLLGRLLSSFGVPGEKHAALFDALADFTDTDNFRRLNGAEAPEYAAAGLPPPPNEWLYSPYQLKSVYGWHLLSDLWNDGRFLSLLTTSRISGFNPNTAPRDILIALVGKENHQLVDEVIRLRKSNRMLASEKIFALVRTYSVESENVLTFPSNSIRIMQQSPDLPWAQEITLTLTPTLESSPWHIDYYARRSVSAITVDGINIPRLSSELSNPENAIGPPTLRPES